MPLLSVPSRLAVVALTSGAMLLGARHAAAQAPLAPTPVTRFGVMAGLNLASISDLDEAESDSRNGFVGGIYGTLPLGNTLSFQPELLFAQRGATLSDFDPDFPGEVALKLSYVEIPLLLRLDVPMQSGGIRPHLYGGPSVAFNTSCSFEAEGGDVDCESDVFGLIETNTFELGAMIGGGIGFPVAGTRQLSVGVRYTFGLTEVFKGTANVDPRNRVLAVYGAFDFPVGGP